MLQKNTRESRGKNTVPPRSILSPVVDAFHRVELIERLVEQIAGGHLQKENEDRRAGDPLHRLVMPEQPPGEAVLDHWSVLRVRLPGLFFAFTSTQLRSPSFETSRSGTT